MYRNIDQYMLDISHNDKNTYKCCYRDLEPLKQECNSVNACTTKTLSTDNFKLTECTSVIETMDNGDENRTVNEISDENDTKEIDYKKVVNKENKVKINKNLRNKCTNDDDYEELSAEYVCNFSSADRDRFIKYYWDYKLKK